MFAIERWHDPAQVAEITGLLHAAYAPLAAAGLRYLATHQDEATTLSRLSKGESYIALEGDHIVGTTSLTAPGQLDHCPLYRDPGVCVFHQFAVRPDRQRCGIGSALLDHVEARALELGADRLACDTAETAHELIAMYLKRGFQVAGHDSWDVVNYRSVLLAKSLIANSR